jgi:hypothetical protein
VSAFGILTAGLLLIFHAAPRFPPGSIRSMATPILVIFIRCWPAVDRRSSHRIVAAGLAVAMIVPFTHRRVVLAARRRSVTAHGLVVVAT